MLTLLFAALTALVLPDGPDPFDIKVEPDVPSGEVVGAIEGSNVTFLVETQPRPAPTYSWFLPSDSTPSFATRTFAIHAAPREHGAHTGAWWAIVSPNCPAWLLLKSKSLVSLSFSVPLLGSCKNHSPPEFKEDPRAVGIASVASDRAGP